MAKKKKIEEPAYVKAPLKITRDEFTNLLTKQIEKGSELLKIEVQQLSSRGTYMGMSMYDFGGSRQDDKVNYEESSKLAFLAAYKIWDDFNKEIYQSSFEIPNNSYCHEYETQSWDHFYTHDIVADYKKQIQRQITQMQSDINKVALIECSATVPKQSNRETVEEKPQSKDIFIVHGHNEEMKQTVARVVTRLGLNPIILHEQANEGRTIIDKFEFNAENIQFAIILLSGDDLAASIKDLEGVKDEDVGKRLEKRARQNVVFEMGYFAGKLGRSKLFYLLQDGVIKPGDLDGLVYTPYDAVGAWKFGLVKELKACGYDVDANRVL
ncbi:MAG: nucleotide-binding protein [Bacteroidales bacterium]|nr:nucleotide-binding protein [Bacteroidales bacterium]